MNTAIFSSFSGGYPVSADHGPYMVRFFRGTDPSKAIPNLEIPCVAPARDILYPNTVIDDDPGMFQPIAKGAWI